MTMLLLYHIAEATRWQAAQESGQYLPASFAADGFIHCSTAAQVVDVANALYRGQIGLTLLLIDPALVAAPILYEDLYHSGQDFPHIYGPLPIAAVLAALPFAPDSDGCFHLPDKV
ncbi:MAG: DUF952 domain-containing protein [Candidatus Promineifilaceae bacterium]